MTREEEAKALEWHYPPYEVGRARRPMGAPLILCDARSPPHLAETATNINRSKQPLSSR